MPSGSRLVLAGLRLAVLAVAAVFPALARAEPSVVVTIKPVHSLVAGVMAGAGQPSLLLDGTASPHDYALKPSDVRRINSAALVVRVSEQLETFLTKPLKLAPKGVRVLTLDTVEGLRLLPLRSGGGFEAHLHAHGHGHSHAHKASTSTAGAAKGVRPSEIDTHLWLDPANARVIVAAVAKALAEIDPPNAEAFASNAAALAQKLDALETSLAARLAPVRTRRYIVFHDAYQYFEARFGLAAAGSVTISPEVAPSAQRLTRIRARLAKEGVACVFAEPQFQPKAVDTIIEGTLVKRGVLDPLGAAITAGPALYLTLMDGLARDLSACLATSG